MKRFSPYVLSGLIFLVGIGQSSYGSPLRRECADLDASLAFDDIARTPRAQHAHDIITSDLYNGKIIETTPFSNDNNQQTIFQVKIEAVDPHTGEVRHRRAIFKPRVWGDGGGYARAPMEYVAYFLSRKLGMDYVPPVAYRKNLDIKVAGNSYSEGAFIFMVPEYTSLAKLPGEVFPKIDEGVISDSRVLNVVLQNKDAHNRNLGLGMHWVDGKRRPVFLDFGASLMSGTNISITNFDVFGNSKPVTRIRRSTLAALREISFETFRPLIEANFINEGEAWHMDHIRHGVFSHFEHMRQSSVNAGGQESNVVIPW